MLSQLCQALALTLVHSLWEGLIIALFAAVLLECTRKASPRLRYGGLTALFLAFLLGVTLTLGYEVRNIGPGTRALIGTPVLTRASHQIATPGQAAAPAQVIQHKNTPTTAGPVSLTRRAILVLHTCESFCTRCASWIVIIWLSVLLFHLCTTLATLGRIRGLRRRNVREPSAEWLQRTRTFASALGIQRPIALLESARVRVPTVIGFLKPAILFPFGILSNLSPDQVEAVLLHELAHIRRGDYLVNLVQHFAERVFFFNPALLWLSARIGEERETCCDEVALQKSGTKTGLIRALLAFQEYGAQRLAELRPGRLALGFSGRKNALLSRVERIVYHRNKTLNAMEKLFFTTCVALVALGTLALTPGIREQAEKILPLKHIWLRDTLPPVAPTPPTTPAIAPVPPEARLRDTLPTINELPSGGYYVENASVAGQENRSYIVSGIWKDGSVTKYFNDGWAAFQKDGVTIALYKDGVRIPDDQVGQYDAQVRDMIEILGRAPIMVTGQGNPRATTIGQTTSPGSATGGVATASLTTDRGNGTRELSRVTYVGVTRSTKVVLADSVRPILEDLVAKGLVSDTDHFSFSLNGHELKVNNMREPDDVFKYFRDKYLHNSKDYITWVRNDLNSSVEIARQASGGRSSGL